MFKSQLSEKLFCEKNQLPISFKKSYYPSLDGLRGISILSVVLSHVGRDRSWLYYIDGGIGVHIFFILSGFLITSLLLKEKIIKGRISLRSFYIRRFLRIIPVAYLFLIVLIFLNKIFDLRITVFSFFTGFMFLKNIPITYDWYTGHYWSLSTEEQFYLFAPSLLSFWPNSYIRVAILFLILVPIVDYIGFHNIGIFYTNRPVHVITMTFLALTDKGALYILSGSLFSILVFKDILKPERFAGRYYLSTALLVAAAIVHYANGLPTIPYLSAIVFTILVGLVIIVNLNEDNLLTKILHTPILNKLGVLSYSIYVWQQIFTVYQPWRGRFLYSDSIAFNMLALLIVSFCSYNFYEIKFLKLKERFKVV